MVSVILPCYDGSRWIRRAIESVLAQTCERFELVIVDDGSTDNSKEMVASHLSDEKVRYVYRRNRGFSKAVNRGIKESSGQNTPVNIKTYILFIQITALLVQRPLRAMD